MIIFPTSYETHLALAQWMASVTNEPMPTNERDFYTLGFTIEGQIVAAVAYVDFRQHCVELCIASTTPRWATRGAIKAILGYPFGQIGLARIHASINERNKHARQFVERVGFVPEGTLRDMYYPDDGKLYAMTRRWWRRSKWSEGYHVEGRERIPTAGAESGRHG